MVQNPIGHSSPPKSDKYHYPPRFFLRGLCIIHDISKLYEIIRLVVAIVETPDSLFCFVLDVSGRAPLTAIVRQSLE